MDKLQILKKKIEACTVCAGLLPNDPKPVFQVGRGAKLLIAGHAPGAKVHASGIPFQDASGNRLREWLGLSPADFYNPEKVAVLPMGFCYPGTGKSGDLPPRPECAREWRAKLLAQLPNIELTVLLGAYAQKWHLGAQNGKTLTATVQDWRAHFARGLLPLPHPSPRNNIWLRKNPWFEKDVIPFTKQCVETLLSKRLP